MKTTIYCAIGFKYNSVNDHIADLSSTNSLSSDKPLWEIHIMMQKRCAIFRIHHALGDGISLMTMLLGNCRKIDDPAAVPSLSIDGRKHPEAGIRLYWRIKFMVTGRLSSPEVMEWRCCCQEKWLLRPFLSKT